MGLIDLLRSRIYVSSGKLIVFAIVGMVIFSSLPSIISEAHPSSYISVSYSFEKPSITKILMGDEVYDNVALGSLACYGDAGEPGLPARGAYILLPQGTKADKIEIIPGEKICLGSGYRIAPVGKSIPLVEGAEPLPPSAGPIYNSHKEFPGKLFDEVGTYEFRGYSILVLRLYPVQCIPAEGKLFYYRSLTVRVSTSNSQPNPLFRGLEEDREEVAKKVDNPSVISTYRGKYGGGITDSYDLLIITTNSLKKYFEPLKEYHDYHGVKTLIVTLDETGDTPDEIRDYIRDAYLSAGIEYVLLGGDDDVVPAKMLWVYGLDENVTPYQTFMPSDLYYGCLDGTYNYDGDNRWGEPTDGEGGHDVDLMAEVYVGRACVGDKTEVNNFVDKTIEYMRADADQYLKKVLLAGEYLGDYGVASWGGNYLDQIVDGSNLDGYTTAGIPSDKFNIEKMYDRDWQNNYWTKEDMMSRIDSGEHIIQHDGHSSYEYNMKMVPDDVENLDNTKYCFIYSNGCMSGGFDHGDCMAEYFTVKTSHGAFATIMNARYGWFWSFRTDGDSQRFVREFWDAVFGESIYEIGRTNQDSKEDNLYIINRSCIRWTYYELNLFGDPSVELRINNAPNKPSAPSGPSESKKGEECTYTASTTDIEGDRIYYMFDWGDGSMSEWLGPFESGEEVSASHSWESRGFYSIKVKAKDVNGAESDWSEPLRVRMPKEFSAWYLMKIINEWFISILGIEPMPLPFK